MYLTHPSDQNKSWSAGASRDGDCLVPIISLLSGAPLFFLREDRHQDQEEDKNTSSQEWAKTGCGLGELTRQDEAKTKKKTRTLQVKSGPRLAVALENSQDKMRPRSNVKRNPSPV